MESDKSFNKRRKSIMVIDKKGQTKEVPKEDQSVSRFIDTTDQLKSNEGSRHSNVTIDKIGAGVVNNNSLKNESINKSNVKENKSNVEDNESINKPNVEENKSNVEDNESINKPNVEENESINKSNVKDNESINKSNVKDNESINKSNVKDNESINKSNVKDNESVNKSNVKDNESINKSNVEEKKTLNMKNAEIAAGATAAGAAGIILGKPSEDKKVSIDENQNEEHSVEADNSKSLPLTEQEKSDIKTKSPSFVPLRIPSHDLDQDNEILRERENSNVEAEGHMWKRRRIFACFWHEKYFLLTKDGILKYHKANGTKKSKGNWDITKFNNIHEVFMGGDNHPFRLALMGENENYLFGFDDSDSREYWLTKLSKFINK